MKVAHIGPTSTLPVLKDEAYHMVIASQVLKDSTYTTFYARVPGWVILDVPTFENGGDPQYSIEDLREVIDAVGPNEIVLPDKWDTPWRDNVAIAKDAARQLYMVTKRGNPRFMVVPHADNMDDYLRACGELVKIPKVDTIGIAERVEQEIGLPRINVIDAVIRRFPAYPVHLLGCLRHMNDILTRFVRTSVRSMDTAKFVCWGLDHKRPTYSHLAEHKGRGKDYFNQKADAEQLACIASNVRYWNVFCVGGLHEV